MYRRWKKSCVYLSCLSLIGCSLWGSGSDKSSLTINRKCKVDLTQAARVAGTDDADVMEKVEVAPDCTTSINFRQTAGDSVEVIEEPGIDDQPKPSRQPAEVGAGAEASDAVETTSPEQGDAT